MLTKIIEFSIRNKLIIALFLIALIGYGAYQTTKLPIDAVPDITNNQVQIITISPSFGATEIERLITFPIEQANSNISGIKEMRSFSRFGLSLVTIVFNDDIDIYWARQQVAERLQKVQNEIPKGIGTPELGPISSGLGEIYQYVLRTKPGYEGRYDETELRTIQDWIVRRQLLGVKGVAEVSSFGGKLKQYEIVINPNKLQAFHITINDVFNALEKNNQNTGGAYIEKGPTVLFIRSEGLVNSPNDIENIFVKQLDNGTPLLIKDVADITIGYATRYGAMCYNDKGEVAGAVVMMLKGANSNQVIKNVKEKVAQIQSMLPEGVVIEPFLDRTKMVNNAIGTVEQNLIEGALIVIFILVLFLGNIRAGLLVASVIPLSMLFAIILMNLFGVSGNLMSLGALDFGLIVDGAVIIVEAVMHQMTHSKKFAHISQLSSKEMDLEVGNSASKMMNSAVFGQIIILIVYLPIFTLEGIEGKMFKPMAQAVAFALLGAFVLSITYIPMMSALFLSKKIKRTTTISDKIMYRTERIYQKWLSKAIQFPKTVISTVILLFVLAVVTITHLGGEFIPALEEGDFAVDTRVLTGSSLQTTLSNTQQAAHVLLSQFPEVEKVVTKIGSGEIPTDPMPMEASDMMVILKDKKQWTSATTFKELSEKMGTALEAVPGITAGFQFPVQMRFNELMTGARQDVVCKIFGENLDTLSRYAQQLGDIIKTVDGNKNLYVEPITGMPQIIISYNRNAIAQYQLDIETINRTVNASFAGQSSGLVFEGEKRFNMVVRIAKDQRKNLDDVKNLLISTPSGAQIPLYQLADVEIKNGPNQIQREDTKRRIIVGFNIHDRDVQSIVGELKQKVEKTLKLPPGYYVTYGGAFENLNAAKERLSIAVPVSLILIFLLLFFTFNSVRQGLLIYTAIPLSAIGGIFFLALRGMPFSISGGVGFIALFGVAVLNGIVLIAEFNKLRADGLTNLHRVVLMGTKVRLRPVLMTAFVASLGFLPMAMSNGAGAEVQRPLATVVIGGLLVATFLTLFLLPVLYIQFEKAAKIKKSKVVLPMILLLSFALLPQQDSAQTSIELGAAIDSALANNLEIQKQNLQTLETKIIRRTAIDLPGTTVSFEKGNISSSYDDNRILLNQSFNLPMQYTAKYKVLNSEYEKGMLQDSAIRLIVKHQVIQLYYELALLDRKLKLLQFADSLAAENQTKTEKRMQSGDANTTEVAMAKSLRNTISFEYRKIKLERSDQLRKFKTLINTVSSYEPGLEKIKLQLNAMPDDNSISHHPLLKLAEHEKILASQRIRLERSKLYPDLNFGFSSSTIQGTGADNLHYTTSDRFNYYQFGLSIPLFFGAQKARIADSKLKLQIANMEEKVKQTELGNNYKQAMAEYAENLQYVEQMEQAGSGTIDSQFVPSQRLYQSGEINFFEYVVLFNQELQLNLNYLDAVNNLNNSINKLNYLTTNP